MAVNEATGALPSITDRGFTVLSDGGNEPLLDIILIHGLQGHPRHTWTYEPPTKRSKDANNNNNTVYWPLDLLPEDLPHARIITYGYDSAVTHWFKGPAMQLDILSYGQSLLNGLQGIRRGSLERPIVFIVHSLGGLILKDTLRRAMTATQPRQKALYSSLEGIIFLGTPHRGGSYVELGLTARKIAAMSGFSASDKVLRDLKFDSSVAKLLREEFAKLLDNKHPKVFTFQEGGGLSGFSALSGKVVEDASSSLDYAYETIDVIEANHINMCKFTSVADSGYAKVRDALLDCLEDLEARRPPQHRTEEEADCLRSLAFPEMNLRRNDIRPPASETCQWLLNHDNYVQWLKQHQGFLWIMGNPGTGKSTLLKYAMEELRAQPVPNNLVVVSFFFHGRGSEIQKSSLGLFRSILHQILDNIPKLLTRLTQIFRNKVASLGPHRTNWEWHEAELRDFLRVSMAHIPKENSIRVYIDALDEGGEDVARDLLAYLPIIVSASLRICVSCRYYPNIALKQSLTIHMEKESSNDIRMYVHQELSWEALEERLRGELEEEMIGKASGSFQWVQLVLNRSLRSYRKGKSTNQILNEIQSLPSELHKLYEEILTSIDPDDKAESLRLMQWVLFAREPLSVTELRFAMVVGANTAYDTLSECTQLPQFAETDEQMEKKITSLSGGLAEVTKQNATRPTVQFIHQSVKDFLFSNKLQACGQSLEQSFQGQGHFCLSRSCVKYITMKEVLRFQTHRNMFKTFPFYKYASRHWIHHSKFVEEENIKQRDLLGIFSWLSDFKISHWRKFMHTDSSDYRTTLLHVAIQHKLLSVVQGAAEGPVSYLECTNSWGETPLLLAASKGYLAAAMILLGKGCRTNVTDKYGATPLISAAANGHLSVVQILLDEEPRCDLYDKYGQTALSYAAEAGYEEITKKLLWKGACCDLEDGAGCTPLSYAIQGGFENIARILLDNGAQHDLSDNDRRTPFSYATDRGMESIARILLSMGARCDLQDRYGRTPLFYAVRRRFQNIVQIILEAAAEPDVRDHHGQTPLFFAAFRGYEEIARTLLENGAQCDLSDDDGKTPLSLAIEQRHENVVRILLKHGARYDLNDYCELAPKHWWGASENEEFEACIQLLKDWDREHSHRFDSETQLNKRPSCIQ